MFSEVVASTAGLCYLVCKHSEGERGERRWRSSEALRHVGYGGPGRGGCGNTVAAGEKELGRQVLSRRGEKVSISASENKATVRRVPDEVFNQGNLSVVDELLAPDYVLHDPGVPGGELRGLEAFKEQWVSMFRTAFPDLRIVIEDQVAEGDKVASRYTGSGTHQGELRGFPPSNNRVAVTGTITSRFVEGKLVEEWNNFDSMGMMQQLGIVPPLAPPQGA